MELSEQLEVASAVLENAQSANPVWRAEAARAHLVLGQDGGRQVRERAWGQIEPLKMEFCDPHARRNLMLFDQWPAVQAELNHCAGGEAQEGHLIMTTYGGIEALLRQIAEPR